MHRFTLAALLGLTAFSLGCKEEPDAAPLLSWESEVREIVATHCTSCHQEGGVAPFAFQTYDEVAASSQVMLAAMQNGSMPPFPADPDCYPYENEARLADPDLATFERWISEGMQEGPETSPIELPPNEFIATQVTRASAPYTSAPDVADDYHCFVLDAEFNARTFITGTNVVPTASSVHHVLVYALTGEQVAHARALEDLDEDAGYRCFGGPLPPIPGGAARSTDLFSLVTGWAPGSEVRSFPQGQGIALEAGTKLVMQIHYSAIAGDASPDQTEVQLQLSDTAPEFRLRTVPLAIIDIDVPANERASFSKTFTNHSAADVNIRALTAHMHLLGESTETTVVKSARGDDDQCGLSISDWDFNWQLTYRMPGDRPLRVAPGQGVRLTCDYDNTAQNQPVVEGQIQAPQNVRWGEGSLDEMCLVYVTLVEPYTESIPTQEEGACAASRDCYAQSDGSLSALYACEETDADCVRCSFNAGADCGLEVCAFSINAVRACTIDCIIATNAFGASIDECLRESCGGDYRALRECADPLLANGQCDEAIETCGL